MKVSVFDQVARARFPTHSLAIVTALESPFLRGLWNWTPLCWTNATSRSEQEAVCLRGMPLYLRPLPSFSQIDDRHRYICITWKLCAPFSDGLCHRTMELFLDLVLFSSPHLSQKDLNLLDVLAVRSHFPSPGCCCRMVLWLLPPSFFLLATVTLVLPPLSPCRTGLDKSLCFSISALTLHMPN